MDAERWIKNGNDLAQIGRVAEAATCYAEAINIDSENVLGWGNLGVMQERMGENAQAAVSLKRCIALAPDYALAHYNLGMLLVKVNRLSEAIVYLEKAEELNPKNIEFILNRGVASQKLGRTKDEIAAFEKVAKIQADYPEVSDRLWLAYRQMGRWNKLDSLRFGGGVGEDVAFTSVVRSEDPAENLKVAKRVAKKLKVRNVYKNYIKRSKKTRVGYFSADLREHPVGQMVEGIMSLHDRSKFEIIALSTSPDDKSKTRKRIKETVDEYVDLSESMSDPDMAERIYQQNIDILVEMTGYTKDKRIGVCAYRPAPVQVEWLGFPGTTGSDFMDYAIVDKIVVPEDGQKYFTEKLLYLPHCYQVNTPQEMSSKEFVRADWGLPAEGFIFGSFNQQYKIDPIIWSVWMKILKRVPKSVLWLWNQQQECSDNLRREAEKRGVDPSRLVFSDMVKKDIHLARLKLTDLGLDTLVYGGHTTTTDYLWAGVPVITKNGTHFASRVCASILQEVGLSDLITSGLEEYENLAVNFANNEDKLLAVRKKITHKKLKQNLFNTERFVRNLERIYEKIRV